MNLRKSEAWEDVEGPVNFGVPSHSRSICAISAIESMEVGSYHFTRVLGPQSQV